MIVDMTQRRRKIARQALAAYVKGIEAAKKASAAVFLGNAEADRAEAHADETLKWMRGPLEEALDGTSKGEVHPLHVPEVPCLTLRIACSVFSTQLAKLAEKELDMLAEQPEQTNAMLADVLAFNDALRGQVALDLGAALVANIDTIAEGMSELGSEGSISIGGQTRAFGKRSGASA